MKHKVTSQINLIIVQLNIQVSHIHNELYDIYRKHKNPFEDFLNEIISTNFLKELHKDCLEIYPKILDAELIMRPALFYDFVDDKIYGQIHTRISVSSFNQYEDLFKDISKILSRLLVLVAGITNLKLRGDYNSFDPHIKKPPKDLEAYVNVPFGRREEYIDDPRWKKIANQVTDNKLRNSIAHYKTEYDEVTQKIVYYPKLDGFTRTKKEELTFMEFACNLLHKFRRLHHLHHL